MGFPAQGKDIAAELVAKDAGTLNSFTSGTGVGFGATNVETFPSRPNSVGFATIVTGSVANGKALKVVSKLQVSPDNTNWEDVPDSETTDVETGTVSGDTVAVRKVVLKSCDVIHSKAKFVRLHILPTYTDNQSLALNSIALAGGLDVR